MNSNSQISQPLFIPTLPIVTNQNFNTETSVFRSIPYSSKTKYTSTNVATPSPGRSSRSSTANVWLSYGNTFTTSHKRSTSVGSTWRYTSGSRRTTSRPSTTYKSSAQYDEAKDMKWRLRVVYLAMIPIWLFLAVLAVYIICKIVKRIKSAKERRNRLIEASSMTEQEVWDIFSRKYPSMKAKKAVSKISANWLNTEHKQNRFPTKAEVNDWEKELLNSLCIMCQSKIKYDCDQDNITTKDESDTINCPETTNSSVKTDSETSNTLEDAPVSQKKKIKVFPCNHMFHDSCIWIWVKEKMTCPICQVKVL